MSEPDWSPLSKWQWVGIAMLDLEGNFVSWQIDHPKGQIQHQMLVTRDGRIDPLQRTKVDVTGLVRNWSGVWPDGRVTEQLAIAHHPPLPLESGE